MRSALRRRAGFSLPELMISLAILGMVTVYLTDMLIRQSRAYDVVDQTTEVQQNVRVLADLLDRELRQAGAMVAEGGGFCGFDFTTAPDVVFLSDVGALTMFQIAANDFEAVVRPQYPPSTYDGQFGGVRTLVLDSLVLDGDPAYDVDVPPDGTRESDFRIGAGVIVHDFNNPDRGTACGLITDITAANNTLTVNWDSFGTPSTLAGGAPLDEDLVAVPANAYWIDTTDPNTPQLIRNGMLLAEDVEDLQFAVFLDSDPIGPLGPDGQVDLGLNEYPGANAQPVYASSGVDHQFMREIRLNFVLRGRYPDPEFGTPANPMGLFQTRENRVWVGGGDQFRRRVYTAAIRPRNIGDRAGIPEEDS